MRSEYVNLTAMHLDLRWPVAVLFLALGGLLAVYDLAGGHTGAEVDLGIRVNVLWGCVMGVFGLLLLLGAWRGRRHG